MKKPHMIRLTLFPLLMILVFSFILLQNSYAQTDHIHSKDFDDLLNDDDKRLFLKNKLSGEFLINFGSESQLKPSKNNILIKNGTTITLNGSPNSDYSTILVEGHLNILNTNDSSLRVQKIIVAPNGKLTIGSNESPIKSGENVRIIFVKQKPGELGIFVFGQTTIHGHDVGKTFSELKSTTKIRDKKITVKDDLDGWKAGDKVVITAPGNKECIEQSEISNIHNKLIYFENPLQCSHRVAIIDNKESIPAHVALLNRNVQILSFDKNNKGSVNYFFGSSGYLKYAEFDHLGPKNTLGRYPIHFHHMKDTSRGIEVIGNSITNSDNRWITIHDSNGILVKNNVGYKSVGHGFFLEDGNEFENVFERNIGIKSTSGELIKSDIGSSIFWTMNPMNTYRGNIAIDGYWGIHFDIPNNEVFVPKYGQKLNLRSLPSIEFDENTAYNNRRGGIHIDRKTITDDKVESSEIKISNLQVMNSYIKDRPQVGILLSGNDVTVYNSTLLNNKIGITTIGTNKIFNTKIINEKNIELDQQENAGILIVGRNNYFENLKIQGYFSKSDKLASDIFVHQNPYDKSLLSAKIVNATLLDERPVYFGNPGNKDSFLIFLGFDAPNTNSKNFPKNFLLKQIGSDATKKRGEYNNLDFMAMIKVLDFDHLENFATDNKSKSTENGKLDSLKSFKNNAFAWAQGIQNNDDFMLEIEILFESRFLEINDLEHGQFDEYDFTIPSWVKKLIHFWYKGMVLDEEFLNAIKFILESQIQHSNY